MKQKVWVKFVHAVDTMIDDVRVFFHPGEKHHIAKSDAEPHITTGAAVLLPDEEVPTPPGTEEAAKAARTK